MTVVASKDPSTSLRMTVVASKDPSTSLRMTVVASKDPLFRSENQHFAILSGA